MKGFSNNYRRFFTWLEKYFLRAGISDELGNQINRRIWISNIFGLSLGTIVAPYIFIFWLLGSKLFGLICIPVTLLYWFIPFINRKGYVNFSRIVFVIVAHLIVLLYAIVFGKKSGIYYLFFLTSSYAILLFDRTERWKQIFSIFLTVFSVSFFEYYFLHNNPVLIVLPEKLYSFLNPLLFFTTLLLVGLINYFFYSSNNRAQEALEKHSRQVEDLVRSRTRDLEKSQQMAHLGNWVWDLSDNSFELSRELLLIHDYEQHSPPLSLRRLADERTHPEDRELVLTFLEEMQQYRVYQPIEYRIINPGNQERWVHASVPEIIEKDAAQKPRKIIGTILDVTNRKHSEQALKESELRLKREMALFEGFFYTIPEKMYIKDTGSRFLRINREMVNFFGLREEEEVLGKTDFDFFTPEHAKPAFEDEQQIMQSGIPKINYEERETLVDGRVAWALSTKMPLRDSHGKITGLVGLSIDITNRKAIEEALEESKEKLIAKNNELENYLYVASHDLRSPLVNIQGFSQRLQKHIDLIKQLIDPESLNPDVRARFDEITLQGIPKSLDFIFSNVSKMDTLINGLLGLSRTGRIKLNIRKVEMNQLMKTILRTFNYQLEETGAELSVSNLPDAYGDSDLLNQLFSNIIGNAIKYRNPGKPLKLAISATENAGRVTYTVADNGIGIASRHLNKIWDVFFRVDSGSDESGEGIGLSIVKRIVDKHKGKIEVESEEGKGSKFHVTLQKRHFTE